MYRFKQNIVLGAIMSKFEYLKLADAVAAEIANGALKPGDRLPPQRHFAYQRKIAVSTASTDAIGSGMPARRKMTAVSADSTSHAARNTNVESAVR